MASIEQHAVQPGDLIYTRTAQDGVLHTDVLWTVDANDGVTNVSAEMPPGTYWTVWVRCDDGCQISGCVHGRTRHPFLLSAGDYLHASRLPECEAQR